MRNARHDRATPRCMHEEVTDDLPCLTDDLPLTNLSPCGRLFTFYTAHQPPHFLAYHVKPYAVGRRACTPLCALLNRSVDRFFRPDF